MMLESVRAALSQLPLGFHYLLAAILVVLAFSVLFAITALALRLSNARMAARWQRLEETWERTTLEVLDGSRPSSALWSQVQPGEELYFVDYLLRFARRLRGAARQRLIVLAAPYLPPLAKRAREGDVERRARAIETLALLGYDQHVEIILDALRDPSPLVAMVAARGVARQQDPRHIGMVVDRLARLQSWSPRHLAHTIASMGSLAVPALRSVLADPSHPAPTRAIVADALGILQDPHAPDLAVPVIAEGGDRELLAACLRLLETAGTPRHAPAAMRALRSADPVIRAHAVSALATINGSSDPEWFRESVNDQSTWVAIHAARALRDLGHRRILRDMVGADHPRAGLARQVLTEAV